LKHPSLQHVDHVDLDVQVIAVCRKHFAWGAAWDDPRVNLVISDGAAFVQQSLDNHYDVIVQDSSDPWTWNDEGEVINLPSAVLYTPQHFQHLHRILTTNGILNLQAETFNIPSDLDGIVTWRRDILDVGFQRVRYGSIIISSYPTGHIGFLMCEKNASASSSSDDIKSRFAVILKNNQSTSYYHPKLQESAFDLPLWVERVIYSEQFDSISKDEL
jgi:spermidine synthase